MALPTSGREHHGQPAVDLSLVNNMPYCPGIVKSLEGRRPNLYATLVMVVLRVYCAVVTGAEVSGI